MNKICILYLMITLFFAACSEKSDVFLRLAEADTLLYHGLVDSADSVLKAIVPKTEGDSACYFVLRAQTDYRLLETPIIKQLNYSIRYYEQNFNVRKLAEAYYYKVCYYIRVDTLPDLVFELLKKAEYLAEQTSDDDLKNKICSAFAYVDNTVGELEESLRYAKKELYYAEKLGNNHDIAYGLMSVSSSFRDLGQIDSAEYYVLQCHRLIDAVADRDKAFYYILMGECFMYNNLSVAERYFYQSLEYAKLPRSYTGLAAIYADKGDTLRWKQYCDSALINAWCSLKIDIFSDMAQNYYNRGNIVGCKNASDSAIASLKEYYKIQKQNYALEIQKKFDFERQQTAYEHKMHILWIIIACLIFISAIITLVYRHLVHLERITKLELEKKNVEAYTKMEEQHCIIGEYTNQIDYLQRQNGELSNRCDNADSIIATNNAAIAKLRLLCDDLIAKTDTILAEGKIVYDLIAEGKSIKDYRDKLAACFYYFEKNFPEKLDIFDGFHDLTIENRIFIIADNLHQNDSIISKIFDIAVSTVRSRRTKIKIKID